MRSRVLPVLFVAFLTTVSQAQAPSHALDALKASAADSQVMEHLHHLVNMIGPRLTGSDNLTNACNWAVDLFKSFGIENARIEEWGTFPVGFNRGRWSGTARFDGKDLALDFTTPAWSPGTRGPVKAPLFLAPEDAAALTADPKYKGAFLIGSPKRISGRARDTAYAEAGVLGGITSARQSFAGKHKDEIVITGGNSNVKLDDLPKTVSISLRGEHYEALRSALDAGQPVEVAFDIRNHFKKGPIPLYNVLAEIKGTERPDEIVIVGGHIDSWDGATGTTDNGTGTATTIEAARLLMKIAAKPKRTIRFMLWSGEEQGLLGSRAYIKAHPEENDRISAVLVHDGGTNYVSGIAATEAMFPEFSRIFAPLEKMNSEMPFAVRKVRTLPYPIGSDHDSYLAAGVPGFFWNQAGRANYTYTHHTQFDTYDAAIPEYQKHTSIVVAYGALEIANLEKLVPREGMRGGAGVQRGPRRRLGIDFASEETLEVTEVAPDSTAAKAGFKVKDRIVKIDGKPIKDRHQLRDALMSDGHIKKMVLVRDGAEVEVTVTFDPPTEGNQ